MHSRKRPAEDSILPIRAPKVPRTNYRHMDGGNATPSQHLGLAARWKRLGVSTYDFTTNFISESVSLVADTCRSIFSSEDQQLPTSRAQIRQPPRPISPPPSASSSPPRASRPLPSRNAPPSRPPQRQLSKPQVTPKPPLPAQAVEASASHNTVTTWADESARNKASTGLPSPPSTEPTASSSSSLTTGAIPILGLHPQLDATLANTKVLPRKRKTSSIRKRKDERKHIFHDQHKKSVKEEMIRTREALSKELYQLKRDSGSYSSNLKDFMGWLKYWERLESIAAEEKVPASPSVTDLRQTTSSEAPRRHSSPELPSATFLENALRRAKKSHESPKPPAPFPPGLRELLRSRQQKNEAIDQRFRPKIKPLPETLPPEDEAAVDKLLAKRGVISKCAREQVSDRDLARLQPCQWLNDEVINFYGQLILSRSEETKENPANGKKKPLNAHYFSTFFWSKLKNEGYEKARLAKWTKKFDLFSKDVVLVPVNHNNAHWTGAVINFRRKRIESYDSMSMGREIVFKLLRGYLDAEHRNKKKKPFDFTGWQDFVLEDTPQQENGYDCGVFTCQFLESISRGEESFAFTQRNMPYMRRRMIWEIGHAKLRDDL